MRTTIVAANWKQNGTHSFVQSYAQGLASLLSTSHTAEVVVFPTFVHLPQLVDLVASTNIQLGAQSSSQYAEGAYTGEISATALAELGLKYVLVGHSERRSLFGETNEVVAAKCQQIIAAGLTPMLCVGETLEARESNQTFQVLNQQLCAVLDALGADAFAGTVVAYEPVWAIGTGKTATPDMAEEAHAYIREELARHDKAMAQQTSILYGGSVKPDNAAALFSQPNVDGGLVGGASLDAETFYQIIQATG